MSILEIEVENQVTDEPILCYVYLGEKIHDVRGISKDETRIRLASKEEIEEKQLFIQVKYTHN